MTRKRRSNKSHKVPEWRLKKLRERSDFRTLPVPSEPPVSEEAPKGPWGRAWQWVGLALVAALLSGALLFVLGVVLWESFQERDEQAAFAQRSVATNATVVGVVRGEAEVHFHTDEGRRVRTVVLGDHSHEDPREFVVRYLPEEPERAQRADHRGTPWCLFPIVLGLLVVFGLGLGGYLLLRRHRRGAASRDGGAPGRRAFLDKAFWPLFVLFVGGVLLIPVGFVVDIGLRYAALSQSRTVEAPVLDVGRQSGSRGGCRGFVTVEYTSHGLRYEERIRIACREIDDHRVGDTVTVEFGATRPDVVRLAGDFPFR